MAKTISLVAGVDPTLPDVTLTIGGKDRKLCFDNAAIVHAEKLTGLNLLRACTFDSLNFSEVRGLLYAALLHDEPELTLAEVDTWPVIYNMISIQAAIATAWFGSVQDPEAEVPGEAKAQTQKRKRNR